MKIVTIVKFLGGSINKSQAYFSDGKLRMVWFKDFYVDGLGLPIEQVGEEDWKWDLEWVHPIERRKLKDTSMSIYEVPESNIKDSGLLFFRLLFSGFKTKLLVESMLKVDSP